MITISYEVLRGLIKEYVLINHDIKIDDTYDIDFNGTEVEIHKIRVGPFKPVKVNFLVGDAVKMFNKSYKDKV